jgi:hypothetical protein
VPALIYATFSIYYLLHAVASLPPVRCYASRQVAIVPSFFVEPWQERHIVACLNTAGPRAPAFASDACQNPFRDGRKENVTREGGGRGALSRCTVTAAPMLTNAT